MDKEKPKIIEGNEVILITHETALPKDHLDEVKPGTYHSKSTSPSSKRSRPLT